MTYLTEKMRKRMATAYDRMKKQKREKADEIIRDLRKEQKTFQDFMLECYELEEGYKERPIKKMTKKAMDIVNIPEYDGNSEDVWRHNQILKHTTKNKGGEKQRKKAQHNLDKYWDRLDKEDELEESSTGEKMGRGKSKLTQFGNLKIKGQARSPENTTTRRRRSIAAIAKRAGLKGTGKLSHHDIRSSPRDYDTYDSEDELDDIGSTKQDHFIRSYKSPRRAASGEQLISKYRGGKVKPSKESVRQVKDFKKSMTKAGADKRGRVHNVNIMHRDSEVFKGDKNKQMERGRNFIAAVKDTPNQLKKAGAKKGEAVVGKPSAAMSGEDRKTGQAKRAKLYKKIFGKRSTKKSEKTGMMVGKAD